MGLIDRKIDGHSRLILPGTRKSQFLVPGTPTSADPELTVPPNASSIASNTDLSAKAPIFSVVIEDERPRREKKPPAVSPEIREVFEVFTGSPSRKFWGKEMEPYAVEMLELMPIEKIRLAYKLLKEGEKTLERPYRVNSPKDFIEKYPLFRLQLNKR